MTTTGVMTNTGAPAMMPRESTVRKRSVSFSAGDNRMTSTLSDTTRFFAKQVPLAVAAAPDSEENLLSVSDTVDKQKKAAVENTREVDPAVIKKLKKSAFIQTAVAVALGLFFVAAITTAVASGGLAIPVAALAGTALMVAVADAGSALYNWQSKKRGGEELPMKGDSIGNLYYLVWSCVQSVTGHKHENGLSDKVKTHIRYASGISRFILGVSSIVLGGVNTVISASTTAAFQVVGSSSNQLGRALMECVNLCLFVGSSANDAQKNPEASDKRGANNQPVSAENTTALPVAE